VQNLAHHKIGALAAVHIGSRSLFRWTPFR